GVMPSYEGQLEPEQIMEITAYIRSIADATGPLAGPGAPLEESFRDSLASEANDNQKPANEPKDVGSDLDRGAVDLREEQAP
ncbi:MAG: hypothetical protein ABI557_14500, partial [Aureliella sp.]